MSVSPNTMSRLPTPVFFRSSPMSRSAFIRTRSTLIHPSFRSPATEANPRRRSRSHAAFGAYPQPLCAPPCQPRQAVLNQPSGGLRLRWPRLDSRSPPSTLRVVGVDGCGAALSGAGAGDANDVVTELFGVRLGHTANYILPLAPLDATDRLSPIGAAVPAAPVGVSHADGGDTRTWARAQPGYTLPEPRCGTRWRGSSSGREHSPDRNRRAHRVRTPPTPQGWVKGRHKARPVDSPCTPAQYDRLIP